MAQLAPDLLLRHILAGRPLGPAALAAAIAAAAGGAGGAGAAEVP